MDFENQELHNIGLSGTVQHNHNTNNEFTEVKNIKRKRNNNDGPAINTKSAKLKKDRKILKLPLKNRFSPLESQIDSSNENQTQSNITQIKPSNIPQLL